MRPVLPSDLDHCVRALLARPSDEWVQAIDAVIENADTADRLRKRNGVEMSHLGDGSLGGATLRDIKAPLPPSCDARYCDALSTVLDGLAAWRKRRIPK